MPSSQVVGAGTKTSVSERQEVACRLLGLRGEPCSLGSERQEVACWLLGLGWGALFTGDRLSVWKDEKFWRQIMLRAARQYVWTLHD